MSKLCFCWYIGFLFLPISSSNTDAITMMMAAATTATKTPPTVDAATFKELAYTVVSWVSAHGRFFITHNSCTHGRLSWIESTSVLSYGSVFIHPLQNRYLGAYPGYYGVSELVLGISVNLHRYCGWRGSEECDRISHWYTLQRRRNAVLTVWFTCG